MNPSLLEMNESINFSDTAQFGRLRSPNYSKQDKCYNPSNLDILSEMLAITKPANTCCTRKTKRGGIKLIMFYFNRMTDSYGCTMRDYVIVFDIWFEGIN